jgi:hypothetical protein
LLLRSNQIGCLTVFAFIGERFPRTRARCARVRFPLQYGPTPTRPQSAGNNGYRIDPSPLHGRPVCDQIKWREGSVLPSTARDDLHHPRGQQRRARSSSQQCCGVTDAAPQTQTARRARLQGGAAVMCPAGLSTTFQAGTPAFGPWRADVHGQRTSHGQQQRNRDQYRFWRDPPKQRNQRMAQATDVDAVTPQTVWWWSAPHKSARQAAPSNSPIC